MKLKLNDSVISRAAYYEITYVRGKKLYDMNGILEIYFFHDKEAELPYRVESLVKSSFEEPYENMVLFNELGELKNAYCECAAFEQYPGYCKHIVATLIKTYDAQKGPFRKITWQKPFDVKQMRLAKKLMDEYESTLELSAAISSNDEEVKLIPKLKLLESGVSLEVSIGSKRMYIIKDLFEFISNMQNQSEVVYGKELTFNHDIKRFDEYSMKTFEFIRGLVMDQQSYAKHYKGYVGDKRNLHLSMPQLERFYQTFLNETIAFQLQELQIKSFLLTNQMPNLKFQLTPKDGGLEIMHNLSRIGIHGGNQTWFFLTEESMCKLNEKEIRDLIPLLRQLIIAKGPIFISKELVQNFLSTIVPRIQPYLDEKSQNYLNQTFDFSPLTSRVYLDVNDKFELTAQVNYQYGNVTFNPFNEPEDLTLVRDRVKEMELKSTFLTYPFKEEDDHLVLSSDDDIYHFMVNGVEELMNNHEVHVTDRFKNLKPKQPAKVQVGVRLQSDLMTFKLEDLAFDISEYQSILEQYKLKKKYHRLKDGAFLELDSDYMTSFLNLVDDLELNEEDLKQDEIQLSKFRALYLDRILDKNNVKSKQNKAFKQLVNDFEQLEEIEYDLPTQLQATLRPYQEVGYRWLKTLSDYGMGGILADDMGLGKTIQVIALICSDKESDSTHPSLIVTPSSLVYNWKAEFEKFAPHLSVLIVSGTVAEREEKLKHVLEYDVVVTSYDLLRRDIEFYNVMFRYAILDEAHYIKNQGTLNAKTVKKVQSEVRFALTGTPLENSIADVWSIFDFILPGYLLTYSKFKKQYETPIVKNQDQKLLSRVHQLVAPFILRRLKKDVLTELPDKIESVVYCELEPEQQKLYEATLVSVNKELQAEIAQNGENQSRMKMLAMLTRLRQLCCHPALYVDNYEHESAKLNLCLELIQESIESGHRILLFSQFTSMFDIIGQKLDELGVDYFTLTGDTKSEERIILANRFNEGEVPIFLISLKAGGTGLNLTGADMVIHYDPWWNMSAQNQATDRAYRMGQMNKVQVYKLIAKGTIEEKIEKLQQRKLALSESLVKEGETFITHLSTDEIQELFKA